MPELAEVEFYRKRWHLAALRCRVERVMLHGGKRIFAGREPRSIESALLGATLVESEARAKQMLFRFRKESEAVPTIWLGIHLGMTGELSVRESGYNPETHDHLALVMRDAKNNQTATLVLTDPRMFGRVQLHEGTQAPAWWTSIAPAILSPRFTSKVVAEFLSRRRRAPIKAVLLMQERFPGVGNWMADEILWRSALHPARLAGSLSAPEINRLWRECRHVCRLALDAIAGRGRRMPRDLNVDIPDSWLFNHRWSRGGKDPNTGTPLTHSTIGGRTTCWSPARQLLASNRQNKKRRGVH